MTSPDQSPAALDWRDGITPVSTRFDDPYFSLAGGLNETRHVFLAGNDLPARFVPGFQIAELGFGTGLNVIATALAAGACPIRFTSFEAYPMSGDEMDRALSAFPEIHAFAAPMIAAWHRGMRTFQLGAVAVTVIEGDARTTLPEWPGQADAWFLDGFSPAKNPELWGDDLMMQVARHTAHGGSFATYTAAGFVRRSLGRAGFSVERTPGYAGKRHMSKGVLA